MHECPVLASKHLLSCRKHFLIDFEALGLLDGSFIELERKLAFAANTTPDADFGWMLDLFLSGDF